jgi:RNA polymerase sigma-70 factor (ECF subfamily)
MIGTRENLERLYDADKGSTVSSPSLPIELAEALSQLNEEERNIVLLSIIGGLSSSEIASLTGLTPGSVRSKLSRSLAKMREFLS